MPVMQINLGTDGVSELISNLPTRWPQRRPRNGAVLQERLGAFTGFFSKTVTLVHGPDSQQK
jgi:hypothetical protein